MRRPFIKSQPAAVIIGLVAFGVGWVALHDAWEGRGLEMPRILRPFTWW